MQFIHLLTAGSLMQAIYILCNHSLQFAHFLQLCKSLVSIIGLSILIYHICLVISEKCFGISHKECMRDHFLR